MKFLQTFLFLLLAIVIIPAAGAVGCDDDDDDAADDDDPGDDDDDNNDDDNNDDNNDDEPPSAEIILPSFPFWPNDAFIIDQDHLNEAATAYCAASGADASATDFLLGALPLSALDLSCTGATPAQNAETYMGDMYLSGYFGGLWLRDILHLHAKDALLAAAGDPIQEALFTSLAGRAGTLISLVREGDGAAVLGTARSSTTILALIYGYNRGYLEQLLENPPDGVIPPEDALVCNESLVFDCDCPGIELAVFDRFRPALGKLSAPPNDRWEDMAALAGLAEMAVGQGHGVWEMIDISALSQAEYDHLIDLSAGFLLGTEAALLGEMIAWADELVGEGRCALLVDAGVSTWSGSYFMGLASTAPAGTFPELICP